MQEKKSRQSRSKKPRLPSSSAPEQRLNRSRAFRFLRDCANLKADLNSEAAEAAYEKLGQRYPGIFQTPHGSFDEPNTLIVMGVLLRKAWHASTERDRDWYLHDAEALYHLETGSTGEAPPPPEQPSALEQVLLHFRQNLRRALLCRNPDCAAPYFMAARKGQKYCSKKCSDLAARKAKLRWWTANRAKPSPPKRRLEPSSSVQPTQPKKGK